METKEIDINLQIERIGFGKFQIIVLAIVLLRQFSYSSTASLLVILEPYLRCYWKLSYMTAAWLVLPEAITKIVGSILLGKMSDRYGRRKTMILAFVFNSYLTLLFSLSTSTVLLSIIRGVIGLVSSSTMIAFTYAMEILPISKRKYMSIFAAGFFAGCGYGILVAMVSLEYLSWRWFDAFAETIPITLAALAVLFLPESPRYLMAVGKTDEAKETLQRIAKRNGALDRFSAFPSYESTNAVTIKHFKTNVDERQQQSKYEMAKRIVVVAFLQFYGDIVSATVRFGSMQFGENSDVSKSGKCSENLTYKYRWAVETAGFFAVFTSYSLLGKVSRGLTMKILVVFLGACLIPFYWPLRGWPLLVAIALTEFGAATLINIILVYRAELLPTSIRTSGCGISDAFGQFGILCGQFIAIYLHHISISLSFGILHGFTAVGIFIVFYGITETKHQLLFL
ncbi:putative transporter SVOPL [Rhopilema esculentum]|uniref:putative transporter SVOPL n=1 Tax=Rhopilema esculentum TaxID=499914 RepID=UPI0031D6F6B8|eukprot:gene7707-13534_t